MKTLKDKFVSDNLWYLVLAYMHNTKFKVVEKWTKYDESGFPVFNLEWLTYKEFSQLAKDAVEFFLNQSQEITEENIEKFVKDDRCKDTSKNCRGIRLAIF